MKIQGSRLLKVSLCAILGALSLGLLYNLFDVAGYSRMSGATRELMRIQQLSLLLRGYADGHDGKFPKTLADLPSDPSLSDPTQYHDPVTKKSYEWLYYPSQIDGDFSNTIIVAAPRALGKSHGHRVVLNHDGSCGLEDEAVFQERLSKQLSNK